MSEYKKQLQLKETSGAGGGKGGGGGGSESADTLESNEIIKILHAIGEGEVNLYTGDGKSIYLNNTPLVNSDGSYNFGAWNQTTLANTLYTGGGSTYWEWRSGTPSQSVMSNPAFPSATAVFTVGSQVLGGTTIPLLAPAPVVYSVSAADVDYCKVAITFTDGIVNVDSNGNIIGDSVELTIDVKPRTSGTWTNVIDHVVNAKSDNAATIQFQVNNPSTGNLWDIRVGRVTQDNSTATRKNAFELDNVEEVQQIQLPYDNIALCGLALDAATIGGQSASIPTMSFLVQRGPISIPNNYNPATNTFTGSWSGTFTTGVTDDPAWVLYDMLTNSQYGLAIFGITASMVDKYSFYNASVFNNALVNNGLGGTEPRFTFNAPIQNRQDVFTSLQQVASMMNASLGYINGLITLFQDRPTNSLYLITKSRVVGSDASNPTYFTYSSNEVTTRYTAVNVTWVNASNVQWLPNTTTITDATGLTRYGYQVTDISAFGATTYGQGHRAGKYWLYENLYNTEQVEFKMGLEGFTCQLEDVIDVFDDDYAGRAVSGRVVSATTNTVTVDQPIIIDPSVTSYLFLLMPDGVTYSKYTITSAPGTYTTLDISGTFSTIPAQYTNYGVVSAIAPRQFRIKDIKIDNAAKEVDITAKLYSNENYTYVEGTYTAPTAVYTQPDLSTPPLAPTSATATATQYINPTNSHLQYGVFLQWTRPTQANVSYQIKWRKDNGQYTTTPQFQSSSYVLEPIVDGTYYFLIYSVDITGRMSTPATVTYTLDTTGGASSTVLTEITDLQINGTSGGTTWTGVDMGFNWTNPAANQGLLKDFVVTLYTATSPPVELRQIICTGVVGGDSQQYIYAFADNQADGLNRDVIVTVQGRDSQNNTTNGITATFTNPSPAVPSDITAVSGIQNSIVSWDPDTDTDLAGYMIWWDTTSGFTPSSADVYDLGNVALASFNNLTKGTTYYYRVAGYDVFGKSDAGTGMNVSSQLSTTIPTNVGVPSGLTLPGTASQGDLFFDTTNNTIYRYTGSAWTNATDGSTIDPASITTSEIAAGTILAANIASGTITGSLIAATTITATNLNISTLSAITANVGTLTAGTISNNSGTNTINLSATGSSLFIDTPNFTVDASGNATFAGTLTGAIVDAGNIVANSITTNNIQVNAISNVAATTVGSFGSNTTFTSGSYQTLTTIVIGAMSASTPVIVMTSIDATVSGSAGSFISARIQRLNNGTFTTVYEGMSASGNSAATYAQIKGSISIVDTPPVNAFTNTYYLELNGSGGTNYYHNACTLTATALYR